MQTIRSEMGLHGTVALVISLTLSAPARAQEPATAGQDGGRKSGTYLQVGLAHGQGNIFRQSSLTNWDVELFGTDYDLVSAKVEVETYFADTFLQISGFSLGYRKDGVRRAEWGHMFSASLFRDFDAKLFAVKVGAGVEWGMPSLNFDKTEFAFADDGTVRYRHTYMHRNADVPFVGTTVDGAVYPIVEVSIVQRPSFLLFELGMRLGITRFNFDDFEVGPDDQLIQASGRKRVLVPYLFADVGIRLF
jgi:hypothetical protein